ncbi:AMP-binding enzyme family protein (macronuclear) [Tetrahymena thermophila SB210]|uniref:AMP-binding enzyme family protein n=1 Tax=Tetrahymena thermophila (strain SB210) TaxID=312017 RepID=W7XCQ2_TETTS|nr:AMP-binding enzyme family protein [Tetrahymena thermophila SB210]EWS74313.1 AMP-binding enzyme family protein [Tetrahymena thermophila SB210]|eukprot:XP_012653134.1 AMP-binding enzyme family protein [Tetrahymena thermophila SB210]
MNFSKIDLFSQHFNFNVGQQQIKKGTISGAILTLAITIIAASYYSYLLYIYVNNEIEPTYRSQNIITQDKIEIDLNSKLVGFRYEYDTNINIDQFQAQNNKTYVVLMGFYYYADANKTNELTIPLNVIKCSDKELQDFYCLDFSQISNQTLILSNRDNIQSFIGIKVYGCLDVDFFKTDTPNNCASQDEIDKIMNGQNSGLRLRMFTSQFNIMTKQNQVNYRNVFIYTIASQLIQTTIKTQKQNTSVKQGLLILQETNFSSPIQYDVIQQSYDRNYSQQYIGLTGYNFVQILMDEIVQEIKIQYPTIPEILALGNSILALLMFLGVIGRSISANSIRRDFFMLILQNLYQGKYMQLLQNNRLVDFKKNPDQEPLQEQTNHDLLKNNIQSTQFQEKTEKIQFKRYQSQATKSKRSIDVSQFNTNLKNSNVFLTIKSPKLNESSILSEQSIKSKQRLDTNKNIQALKAIYDQSYLQKVSKILFSKSWFKKKQESHQNVKICKYERKIIEKQLNKELDIYQIYQDLLFLKKAIMIILDKDQLAAIKFVGCSQNFFDKVNDNTESVVTQLYNEKKMTHFEEQFTVLQSEDLQYQCIKQFISKCQNERNMSEIDKKILSSLN